MRSYFALLVARCLVGILDVIAVLGVGYLATSIASFVTYGENEGKLLNFAGLVLPAITAKTLPITAVTIVILFLAKAIFTINITRIMATQIAIVEARAAKIISQNVLGSTLEKMKSVKREDLAFAVQIGTSSAFTGLLNAFASLVSEGVLFLLLSIAFLIINPLATLAMLVYFALLVFVMNWFIGKRLNNVSTEAYKKIIDANRVLTDLTDTFRELAVAGSRGLFFERIHRFRKDASQNIGIQTYLAGMPRHIIETGLIVGIGLFILAQSGSTNLSGTAATIGVFLAGGFRIVAAMLPWQNALVVIKINIPQSKTTWEILQAAPESKANEVAPDFQQHTPVSVVADNLCYEYEDGHSAIKNMSFEIEAGSNVAFIGPSGAGKSTIADLILGIATPSSGKILIDGNHAMKKIKSDPGIASYVPQAPGIVSGTIRENIAISQNTSSVAEENLAYAIRESYLEPFLSTLERGLDTEISPQGAEFSGGQRQRIGLARALYTKPGLLVLDEATSALDAESEQQVVTAVKGLRGSVTVVTIAHRLNSIKDADKVFYIEDGRLIASGTLAELQLNNENVARAIELLSLENS